MEAKDSVGDQVKTLKLLIPMMQFGRFGGHRVLSRIADELQKRGRIQVTFLAPDCSASPYFSTSAKILYCDDDGQIVTDHSKPKVRMGQEIISLGKCMRRIESEYDIVLINDSMTWLPTLFSGAVKKSLYYIQAYEPDFYKGSWSLKRMLQRAISYASYHGATHQIVNAPLYLGYGPINATEVVCPGIDLGLFHPKDPETFWFRQGRPITIGTVGRQEPIKGTHAALAGIKAFVDAGHKIRLRVALGNVPPEFLDLPYLEVVQIESDAQLADYYRSLDVLVVAGAEQFGAVHYPTLEGLASGVAVVTTPYHPANEGNAWMLGSVSKEVILEQLKLVAATETGIGEKRGKAAKDVLPFSWPIVGTKMEGLIVSSVSRQISDK
jgi:glycosyltransferase involved in cell wall biosynthesis